MELFRYQQSNFFILIYMNEINKNNSIMIFMHQKNGQKQSDKYERKVKS